MKKHDSDLMNSESCYLRFSINCIPNGMITPAMQNLFLYQLDNHNFPIQV